MLVDMTNKKESSLHRTIILKRHDITVLLFYMIYVNYLENVNLS